MDLGLATAAATGAGVYLVYGEKGKVAAASAVVTGLALYIAYYWKLRCNPNVAPFMMGGNGKIPEKQIIQTSTTVAKWKPLTEQEIQNIRNIVNSSPIKIVSDP